jgi:hypothetical protein
MKTCTPALANHMQQPTTSLCRLLKITRNDGTVYRYTDHDQPLAFTESVTTTPEGTASTWSANPSPPAGVTNASPWASYWSLSGDAMTYTRDTTPNPDGSGFSATYAGGAMTVTGIDFDSISDIGTVQAAIGRGEITYEANLTFSDNTYVAYYTTFHGHWGTKFGLSDGLLWTAGDRYVGFAVDWITYGNDHIHLRSNVSGASGPITDIDTGISASANHDYKFTINAAGTLVTWYIDGISVGTSSNVPNYNVPMMFWWEVSAIYCTESFTVTSLSCVCTLPPLVTPNIGTYSPLDGVTFKAVQHKSDASPNNTEVTGFITPDGINENDIRARLYDNAIFELRVVNWQDLTMGDMKMLSGPLGDIEIKNGEYQIQLRGWTEKLKNQIGSTYGPVCRAELFGSGIEGINPNNHWKCQLNRADWVQTGTVDSSPDEFSIVPPLAGSPPETTLSEVQLATLVSCYNAASGHTIYGMGPNFPYTSEQLVGNECTVTNFENPLNNGTFICLSYDPTDIDAYQPNGTITLANAAGVASIFGNPLANIAVFTPAPPGWFNDGIITFTSGVLNGYTFQIATWDGTTLVLFAGSPMPQQPSAGDTYDIEPGCDHTRPTCASKFHNAINFAGEADIPGLGILGQCSYAIISE